MQARHSYVFSEIEWNKCFVPCIFEVRCLGWGGVAHTVHFSSLYLSLHKYNTHFLSHTHTLIYIYIYKHTHIHTHSTQRARARRTPRRRGVQ